MREKEDPCFTVCEGIVQAYRKSLRAIFWKELREDGKHGRPNYMKQTFLGSIWRAFWAILISDFKSFKSRVNILALAISIHRQEHHSENKAKEIKRLKGKMSADEIKAGTRSKGWNS